jgi:hypothetical protein
MKAVVQLVITPDLPVAKVALLRRKQVIFSLETSGDSRTLSSRLLEALDRLRRSCLIDWGELGEVVVEAKGMTSQRARLGVVVGQVLKSLDNHW